MDAMGEVSPAPPDLATLTGVRSGKRSYYSAYVRSDERMQRAVRAMDSISRALVRTVEGPRALLEEVVRAAAAHLAAEWTILALSDGHLRGARPRFLVLGRFGEPSGEDEALPALVRRELTAIRAGHAVRSNDHGRWVRVPMTLEGRQVGSLVGLHGLTDDPEPGDLSVLRILANQAAVSLHTSEQHQAGLALHRRAQRLYEEATVRTQDLEARTRELHRLEERLAQAYRRELIDGERQRIARELHDSVTQYVLSTGMALELARTDAEGLGPAGADLARQLGAAKQLTQEAVDQLRSAIYALHHSRLQTFSTLPELLSAVADHHRPHLTVAVRVDGKVASLPEGCGHEIARAVGEALFNVAVHARASRAVIRLQYRPDRLTVTVADDGQGNPSDLRRRLRLEQAASDGHHRGLLNIQSRITGIGGQVAFRRSGWGGVKVELRVPLPLTLPKKARLIEELLGTGQPAPPEGGSG